MKAQNKKNRWWIHILIIASLLLVTLSTNVQADCRLLGMIAKDYYYLYNETNMVEDLLNELQAQGGDTYPYYDGWCLLFYRDDNEIVLDYDIWRDADPAYNDNDYDIFQENFVNQDIEATVGMGHVRSATNVPDIPDPHPFVWRYEPYGHQFTFAHNGTVDKEYIVNISGFVDWCVENDFEPEIYNYPGMEPPPWWYPEVYEDHVVDTEIYFFLVMWRIYLNDGDIISGIHEALNLISDLTYWPTTAKNFIFSDNEALYVYRKYEAGAATTYELYYFNDPNTNIHAAMSDPGDNPAPGWNYIGDDTLVYLQRNCDAVVFPDFAEDSLFVHHLKGGPSIRWNWVSFPVLEYIEPIGTNALDVLAPILDPDVLEGVWFENQQVIGYEYPNWYNNLVDDNFHTIDGYKIKMNQNAVLHVSGDWELQTTEIPLYENQENWIGYFLDYSQSIGDAFSSIWDYIICIKSKHWTLCREFDDIPMIRGTVNPGELYIVTVSEDCDLIWGTGDSKPAYVKPETELFTHQEETDYMPIFVDSTDAINGINEIGVFLGDKCIGASKKEGFPVFIPVYIEEDSIGSKDYNELTFQVATYGKGGKRGITAFIYNETQNAFVEEPIILDETSYAIVRLGTGEGIEFPIEFTLFQNYPNPVRSSTTICFSATDLHRLPQIKIYNVKGQLVKTLTPMTNDQCPMTNVVWDGKDENGNPVSSGIYFYKLISGEKTAVKKMVLMR